MASSLAKAGRGRHEMRGVISFDASAGPTPAVYRLPLSPSSAPLVLRPSASCTHARGSTWVRQETFWNLFSGQSKRSGQRRRCHPGRDRTAIFGWLPVWECRRLGSRGGGSLAVWWTYLGRCSLFCGGREGARDSFGWHSRPFSPATYFLSTSGLRDCASRLFPMVIRHFSDLICSQEST